MATHSALSANLAGTVGVVSREPCTGGGGGVQTCSTFRPSSSLPERMSFPAFSGEGGGLTGPSLLGGSCALPSPSLPGQQVPSHLGCIAKGLPGPPWIPLRCQATPHLRIALCWGSPWGGHGGGSLLPGAHHASVLQILQDAHPLLPPALLHLQPEGQEALCFLPGPHCRHSQPREDTAPSLCVVAHLSDLESRASTQPPYIDLFMSTAS